MAIELVTGYAGAAHISSADDGMFNIGAFGSGKYVLETASQLAASVVSANSISIAAGDALFEGRHVRLSSAETVAIGNGAQGVNRNDIICIKYEKASGTNIETASLAVIKGTAAATATDPTIPSGSIAAGASTAYMPLWRIPISGITVGTPEQMFTVLPSVSDIGGTVPVSRGGTGATDAATALKNIMSGKTVLYNNATGTNGNITLSQTAANFDHMRIYYRANRNNVNYYSSVDVYAPNGKTAVLQVMMIDGSYAYHNYKAASISARTITVSNNGYGWYGNNQSSATTENQNNIYVVRVEGWKEA